MNSQFSTGVGFINPAILETLFLTAPIYVLSTTISVVEREVVGHRGGDFHSVLHRSATPNSLRGHHYKIYGALGSLLMQLIRLYLFGAKKISSGLPTKPVPPQSVVKLPATASTDIRNELTSSDTYSGLTGRKWCFNETCTFHITKRKVCYRSVFQVTVPTCPLPFLYLLVAPERCIDHV